MKKFTLIKNFTFTLLILNLFACTTTKPRIVVAPEVATKQSVVYQQESIALTITDLRTSRHIIQILKENKAAELINSSSALDHILTTKFTQLFQQQGLIVSENSNIKLDIAISKALISVQQNLVNYKANTEIIIQVKVNNPPKVLTKSFRIRGTNEGPFKADIAVLSRDFNQQLAQLIEQIVNDTELQTFITN